MHDAAWRGCFHLDKQCFFVDLQECALAQLAELILALGLVIGVVSVSQIILPHPCDLGDFLPHLVILIFQFLHRPLLFESAGRGKVQSGGSASAA